MTEIIAEVNLLIKPTAQAIYGIPNKYKTDRLIPISETELAGMKLNVGDLLRGELRDEMDSHIFVPIEHITVGKAIDQLINSPTLPIHSWDKPLHLLSQVVRRDMGDIITIYDKIRELEKHAEINFIDSKGAREVLRFTEQYLKEVHTEILRENFEEFQHEISDASEVFKVSSFGYYIKELKSLLNLKITPVQLFTCIKSAASFEAFENHLDELVERLLQEKIKRKSLRSVDIERLKKSSWVHLAPLVIQARLDEINRTVVKKSPRGYKITTLRKTSYGSLVFNQLGISKKREFISEGEFNKILKLFQQLGAQPKIREVKPAN